MKYLDHDFFLEKLRELALAREVLDIGGGEDPAKLRFAHVLAATRVQLVDFDPKTNPDVVADIMALPFPDASAEAIICTSVLQHVTDPVRATSELKRILRPGGKLLLSVPFAWPYHGGGEVRDYYRFSEDAIKFFFKDFQRIEIVRMGGTALTILHFIPFDWIRKPLWPIGRWVDRAIPARHTTPGYCVFAIK